MALIGMAIERRCCGRWRTAPPITLFMATLGLAYIVEGGAQLHLGRASSCARHRRQRHAARCLRRVGRPNSTSFAAGVAGLMVAALIGFFQYTRVGLAFRAAAADAYAAAAVGLRLPAHSRLAWIAAGFTALVAGLLWGARLGVQFSLSLVVLKALPVLVLGGFDSILGAIVGGLIVGATEKLAEVYIGPFFGGGIEIWFAYVVALGFPAGAARRPVRPRGSWKGFDDERRLHSRSVRAGARLPGRRAAYALAPVARLRLSVRGDPAAVPGARRSPRVGLNLLTGYTGQVSLGSAAFLAIGAYAAFNLNLRVHGLPLPVTIVARRPSRGRRRHRLRSAEPAAARLLSRGLDVWRRSSSCNGRSTSFPWFSNNSNSGVIDAPKLQFAGVSFSRRSAATISR